jgi:hypothetical protein
MLKSDAYKKISNASRVALLLLRAQLKNHEQTEVNFPYSHAQAYMKKNTFARSIRELVEMKFIEKTQSGGLYRKTNSYSFTDGWEAYKKPTGMAYYIRGTEKGTVKKWNFERTGTEKGTVGK